MELYKDLPQEESLLAEVRYKRIILFKIGVKYSGKEVFVENKLFKELGIPDYCKNNKCGETKTNIKDIKDINLTFDQSAILLTINYFKEEPPLISRLTREKQIVKFAKNSLKKPNHKIDKTRTKVKIENYTQYHSLKGQNFNRTTLRTNLWDTNIMYENFHYFNGADDPKLLKDRFQIEKRYSKNLNFKLGDYADTIDPILRGRLDNTRGFLVDINQNSDNFYKFKKYTFTIDARFELEIFINGRKFNYYPARPQEYILEEDLPLRNGVNFITLRYFGPYGEQYEEFIVEKVLLKQKQNKISARFGILKERNSRINQEDISNDFVEIDIPYKNIILTLGHNRNVDPLDTLSMDFKYQKITTFYKNLDYQFIHVNQKRDIVDANYKMYKHNFNFLINQNNNISAHYINSDEGYFSEDYRSATEEFLFSYQFFKQKIIYLNRKRGNLDLNRQLTMFNFYNYNKNIRFKNNVNYNLLNDTYRGVFTTRLYKFLELNYEYARDYRYLRDARLFFNYKKENILGTLGYIRTINPQPADFMRVSLSYTGKKFEIGGRYLTNFKNNYEALLFLRFGFGGNTENNSILARPITNSEDLLEIISYIDENHNGKRDEGEKAISNVGYRVDFKREKFSDKNGQVDFMIPTQAQPSNNSPVVSVLMSTPPENIFLKPVKENYLFHMNANLDNILEIPYQPFGEIYGSIVSKRKKEHKIKKITLINTSLNYSKDITVDEDGYFMEQKLKPGKYQIFIKNKLAKTIIIPKEGASVDTKISH